MQDRINTFLLLLIFVTNLVVAVFISKFSSDLDSIRTATHSTAAYTETIQKSLEKKESYLTLMGSPMKYKLTPGQ